MNEPTEVQNLGHGLFQVRHTVVNVKTVAENLVEYQDGDTVARLFRIYTGKACEFLTGDLWLINDSRECDAHHLSVMLYRSLLTIPESSIVGLILDYCGPFRLQKPVAVH